MKKEEKFAINTVIFYLKKLGKEKQIKSKVRGRKKIIQIKV